MDAGTPVCVRCRLTLFLGPLNTIGPLSTMKGDASRLVVKYIDHSKELTLVLYYFSI